MTPRFLLLDRERQQYPSAQEKSGSDSEAKSTRARARRSDWTFHVLDEDDAVVVLNSPSSPRRSAKPQTTSLRLLVLLSHSKGSSTLDVGGKASQTDENESCDEEIRLEITATYSTGHDIVSSDDDTPHTPHTPLLLPKPTEDDINFDAFGPKSNDEEDNSNSILQTCPLPLIRSSSYTSPTRSSLPYIPRHKLTSLSLIVFSPP
ncbi:hypothetical protein BDQ17DRAFT_1427157 [Cyathus striatus]|nr:hypothetical protein BDQ17DRAFT_1427157 [Cyathus striatus]